MMSERNTVKNDTFGNEQDVSGREMELFGPSNCLAEENISWPENCECRRIVRVVPI